MEEDRKVRLELVAIGQALARLKDAEGFSVYMELVQKLIAQIGTDGLRDKTQPREYWVGAQDILLSLQAAVDDAIRGARQVSEDEEAEGRMLDVRLGSGTLAV